MQILPRAHLLLVEPDCPVAVMAAEMDASRATTLFGLKVRRVILKPFKVKTVLETVVQLVNGAPGLTGT